MDTIHFFRSLPFNQKIRWLAHFLKVRFKKKERSRSLALASYVEPGGVIIDAGAHLGYLTKEFARAHKGNIQVIAFEPGDYCMSILRLIVKKLRNVTLVKAGLGNKDGFDQFRMPIKKRGMLGIGLSQVGGKEDANRKYLTNSIEVKKLDTYAAEHKLNRIDLIKADVEGGELEILRGSLEVIKKFKPIWYLEVDNSLLARFGATPSDLFEFMDNLDYAPYVLQKNGMLTQVESYDRTKSFDYFFKAKSR